HPIESSERQIVRAQKDQQSRKKQVQVVETHGHKKQHRKRQHQRDLHPQPVERILPAQGRAAARQTQHQLREREDEKSPDDSGQNRRFWSDPGAQRRGHQPNDGRDKLSPKAANVDRPAFALRILNVHSNLRNGGVAARYISTPRKATTNAAELLGKEKELGAVAPGYFADLVAVEGDALVNIIR